MIISRHKLIYILFSGVRTIEMARMSSLIIYYKLAYSDVKKSKILKPNHLFRD